MKIKDQQYFVMAGSIVYLLTQRWGVVSLRKHPWWNRPYSLGAPAYVYVVIQICYDAGRSTPREERHLPTWSETAPPCGDTLRSNQRTWLYLAGDRLFLFWRSSPRLAAEQELFYVFMNDTMTGELINQRFLCVISESESIYVLRLKLSRFDVEKGVVWMLNATQKRCLPSWSTLTIS